MKNSMDDLRNHLFAALEGLADEEKPMEIERARAVAEVAQTVINAAKVQVDYIKTTGKPGGERFFQLPEETEPKQLPRNGSGK